MQKILIAEDDTDLCQLFSYVLTKNNYLVTSVFNGAEALEAIRHEHFDLLISDIMMPIMDGNELVKNLRSMGNTIPVLMITAKGQFDDMEEGFRSGTDDYMTKPVDEEEMLLRIQALLRRARISSEHVLNIGNVTLNYDSFSVNPAERFQLHQDLFSGFIIQRSRRFIA
jgi:DNA-binding response OmpR family regulator